MEEELKEQDKDVRHCIALQNVDQTQSNLTTDLSLNQLIENAQQSTVQRYWHNNNDHNPYRKINTTTNSFSNKNSVNNTKEINKHTINTKANDNKSSSNSKHNDNKTGSATKPNEKKSTTKLDQDNQNSGKPKEERSKSLPAVDLSLFQSPPAPNIKKTIEILDHDIENQVILDSSDEDEVIEVALPPKPTITIESSDEDEIEIIKTNTVLTSLSQLPEKSLERDISTSPVPSVVSSVSDEFIRSDCIAWKISSRHPDSHSFDFSLHGSDLLDQCTPSKKKKKKKTKDAITSTPINESPEKIVSDECFATPKGKAKNKKPKRKTYTVSENSVPNVDVYDSDSNHSVNEIRKQNYEVTDKSLPNADVYESDSNQLESNKAKQTKTPNEMDSSGSSATVEKNDETPKSSKRKDLSQAAETDPVSNEINISTVDLTESDESFITLDNTGISESIVMGNVTGFDETEDYREVSVIPNNLSMLGSTKVPAILNEDLDFDNLKGTAKVCKRRRYSLTTLRAEMEKFYNESWGGEDFNHREIQKSMSRDKSLWAIDPKDRMSSFVRKKVTCNYCDRAGHRDDTCRMKTPVCHMCGNVGHYEPRCPTKICVNCGSPNFVYSSICGNCRHWGSVTCNECGQRGHPASHCPDIWRRYHNTIDNNTPLQKNLYTKKHYQLFCSGCTKRGHLIHTCRSTIPFSNLPINTPYVCLYKPIYPNNQENNENTPNYSIQYNRNSQDFTVSSATTPKCGDKRPSPILNENIQTKKRKFAVDDDNMKIIDNANITNQKKALVNDDVSKKVKETPKNDNNKNETLINDKTDVSVEKTPDFILITPSNQDKKGNMIQDNEVSDTSSAVTSARIYVTNDVIEKLKTKDGQQWLKETSEKHDVKIQIGDVNPFVSIRGKVPDQEAFQIEFRKWAKNKTEKEKEKHDYEVLKETQNGLCNLGLLPKNRQHLIRTLNKAIKSLQYKLGDPKKLYKQLTFLKNQKHLLLMNKEINGKQLANNRSNMNRLLKALNMVLIGQAGLADGTQHLNELHTCRQRLLNSNEMLISSEDRMEILEHYSSIFGPIYRDDYTELLSKYYISKTPPSIYKKKNKDTPFKVTPKRKIINSVFSIPTTHGNKEYMESGITMINKQDDNRNSLIKKKLLFYHRRLVNSKPSGGDLKKKRSELTRRLHSFIASMNTSVTSKKLKKIKRVQHQVQMFLADL